jgi:hypothetical protein
MILLERYLKLSKEVVDRRETTKTHPYEYVRGRAKNQRKARG